MIIYHTSRALAEKFDINLAKWKRWSREFLPPDPLGGMQSGFARQYHPDQAFAVRLGGHLVADLKLSIPEARRVLADLQPWIKANGYGFNVRGGNGEPADSTPPAMDFLIFILPGVDGGFRYIVRGLVSRKASKTGADGVAMVEERYTEQFLHCGKQKPAIEESLQVKVLSISRVLVQFVHAMGFPPIHYPGLYADKA